MWDGTSDCASGKVVSIPLLISIIFRLTDWCSGFDLGQSMKCRQFESRHKNTCRSFFSCFSPPLFPSQRVRSPKHLIHHPDPPSEIPLTHLVRCSGATVMKSLIFLCALEAAALPWLYHTSPVSPGSLEGVKKIVLTRADLCFVKASGGNSPHESFQEFQRRVWY